MSGRFANPRVVDLAEATVELRVWRRFFREQRPKCVARKLHRLHIPRLALWVVAFYVALAACTALWWHRSDVGFPRLLTGTLLPVLAPLAIGREVVRTHPACILLLPAVVVVAAFFWYPLAPVTAVLAIVFVVKLVWFA